MTKDLKQPKRKVIHAKILGHCVVKKQNLWQYLAPLYLFSVKKWSILKIILIAIFFWYLWQMITTQDSDDHPSWEVCPHFNTNIFFASTDEEMCGKVRNLKVEKLKNDCACPKIYIECWPEAENDSVISCNGSMTLTILKLPNLISRYVSLNFFDTCWMVCVSIFPSVWEDGESGGREDHGLPGNMLF